MNKNASNYNNCFATIKNTVEYTKLGIIACIQRPFTTDKIKLLLE